MGEAKRKRLLGIEDWRAFHYTTVMHLPWIIAGERALTPSRHIRRLPGARGVIWFSTDARKPDPTSTARRSEPYTWVRFSVPANKTMPWEAGCRAVGWNEQDIALAAKRAQELGADTSPWRVMTETYHLPHEGPAGIFETTIQGSKDGAWLEIYHNGSWGQFEAEVGLSRDQRHGFVGQNGTYLEVHRLVNAYGAYGYAANLVPERVSKCAFDHECQV